ncbi:carbohydrate ABC transporter permease [Cryptosporangium phraense]|uniref:Sugar ABC transporter permease n=1 Tax=Cryptosporangium phraense TaxID=2593070 RepID=A0A545AX04_9ACTN|nr:sugar ABC transporter permease [Cryptosporangium phraense]TQS45856.1 sugar ABC transporter permease [Cryptosporangium phraense]
MAVLERVEVAAPPRPRRRDRIRWSEALWGYALIAPTGLGLLVFYLWPVLQTAYLSFTETGPFGGPATWTGLNNYRELFSDGEFGRATLNTILYTVLGLLGVPIAVVFAALLSRPGLRGVAVYRTIFFLPVVTTPVAIAMIWRWVYNGDFGILNYLLSLVGIEGPHWVADSRTALIALVIVGIWTGLGYNLVIFIAGVKGIPRQYYEAAEIDGAGPIQQFFRITVPLLSPTIFFVSVVSVIGSLQLFDLVYVIAGGSNTASRANPAFDSMETIVYLFYAQAFQQNDKGYGAAIAMMLLVLIVGLTAVQFRMQKRWVTYD